MCPAVGRRCACRQQAVVAQAETAVSITCTRKPGLGAGSSADGQAREPPSKYLCAGLCKKHRLLHRSSQPSARFSSQISRPGVVPCSGNYCMTNHGTLAPHTAGSCLCCRTAVAVSAGRRAVSCRCAVEVVANLLL